MVPIVLSIIFRRQINPQKLLDKIRDDHDKEVDILNRSHQKEIEDRENAKKRYDIAIKELEEKYRNSEGELDKKKKKEVEKALKNHSSDPDEITRRIAEITGFEIHVS
jgi:aspartyl/asparaginyl-tRNA synthetase